MVAMGTYSVQYPSNQEMASWPNGKALDYDTQLVSRDSGFDPQRGHLHFFFGCNFFSQVGQILTFWSCINEESYYDVIDVLYFCMV